MNKQQLKEKVNTFLELYIMQMGGLSLVCSIFYWVASGEIFNFLKKVVPLLDRTNLDISIWTLIILVGSSVIAATTISICIFGVSDTCFNREAFNNSFNS